MFQLQGGCDGVLCSAGSRDSCAPRGSRKTKPKAPAISGARSRVGTAAMMLPTLTRMHGQLLDEPLHRTTEGRLAMRDALARAKLELQADMQSSIDRNNAEICQLLAIVKSRSAALKRMQRAVRAPTPVTSSQQQRLSTLQATLDEVRRKRDVAAGENNRLLRKLKELQVEVDGLKQLSTSVNCASASAAPASRAATRLDTVAVASMDDVHRYAEEQAAADAQLLEMEALVRTREDELQRMRKDAAQFDTRYESALSDLRRAQASVARRKIERAVCSQGRREAESTKRHAERQAAAAQLEQRATLSERQEELHGAKSEALHRMLQLSGMAMNPDGGTGQHRGSTASGAAARGLDRGSSSGRPSPTTTKSLSNAASTPQAAASLFLQAGEQDATSVCDPVNAPIGVDVKRGATVADMAAWALLVREAGVAEPRDVAERLARQRSAEQTRTLEREAEARLRQLVDEARVLRDRHDWLERAIGEAAARRQGHLSESVAASSEQIEGQSRQRAAHTAALLRAQAAVSQLRARWAFTTTAIAESGGERPDAAQLAAILAQLCASIREARGDDCGLQSNPARQAGMRTTEKRAALDALLHASQAAADDNRGTDTACGGLRPASSAAARLPGAGGRRTSARQDASHPRSAAHGCPAFSASREAGVGDQSARAGSHTSIRDTLCAADTGNPSLASPSCVSAADFLTATDRLLGGLIVTE
jgi:hypothetical protein